jgi:hypothetical protein
MKVMDNGVSKIAAFYLSREEKSREAPTWEGPPDASLSGGFIKILISGLK